QRAAQRRMREPAALAGRAPIGPLRALVRIAEIAPEKVMHARRVEHRSRRHGLGNDRRTSGTKDAGLLAPDRLAIRAEVIDVIDAYARQHSAVRIDDVHRIEPPAEADLEHRRLD